MIKRGLKRKFPTEWSDPSVQDDYQRGLTDFQTAARKRESMRLKNTTIQTWTEESGSSNGFQWEQSLVQKIGLEQKVIEGTSRFFQACKSLQERLEAAKTLQLSKLRIDVLKYELNKHRRGRGSPPLAKQQGKPSYGGVSLSDIRIPLVWRPPPKDGHDEQKRAHSFAIFCIARIGSQIYDTSLIQPVDDLSCADVSIPDVIEFNRIAPHFEMILEVYAHALDFKVHESSKELSMMETPQKIVRTISKAVGRKMQKDTIDIIGPKFEMVASVTLTLEDCNEEIHTHELYVGETNSPKCPALFGQICCRLAAKPYCCEEEVLSGLVGLQKQGATKVQKMWSRLMDWKLSLWNDLSHKEAARRPIIDIPVNRDASIIEKGNNCITLTTKVGEEEPKTWELVFEDCEEKDNFLVHLFQHAADHRRWKRAATSKMSLYTSSAVKSSSSLGSENVPLYESIVTKKRRNTLKRAATVKKAKSFKRTKSKLALIYNQTGNEDAENRQPGNQVLI